ncbi:MAG: hypothetical protein COU33_01865 [Candidatus Magasanikbacteria bacterium CG10_big_fil_rev_8_21_14_0_10_43_6]|uniref:Glycerophosphoryl diester phosphodiesterase membrane domain-containing protein n=1 Tax=Candidatus Magasanikbacteria bacterium CG10_big_fil_rev_8_21_14_0_10_43_6 TaxID=1974650 RepID=A0A2M6W1H6_9BACT|nr:MAG: hypothetical protein COU33_01865 [Candidatus Magasanikbacteria bacterium CG10_big_fil_rev_8_21_14_0_10_43_6]
MEQQKSVPIGESLKYGWHTMKENIGFFILLLVVYYVVYFGASIVVGMLSGNNPVYIVLNIALIVWSLLLSLGLIHITLAFVDSKKPTIGELFGQGALLGQAILLYILYTLIVMAGILLLVVPGIIWSLKYSQAFYLLVDKKMSATEALKKSGELTSGVKLELFGFGIVSGLVILAGLLALVVGLFAAIPTVMIATTFVYRRLLSQTGAGGSMPATSSATPMPPNPTV